MIYEGFADELEAQTGGTGTGFGPATAIGQADTAGGAVGLGSSSRLGNGPLLNYAWGAK